MLTKQRATVEDLYNVPENGKAELINGELVRFMSTGYQPGRAGFKIAISLSLYEDVNGGGHVLPDNVGFLVDLPNRKSFSPDAAWFVGPTSGMKFLNGPPLLAVEVRSENDYGASEDAAILDKIRDYFDAGTQIVWDVDLQSEDVITAYYADHPDSPTVFRRDEIADAEPAVPGWRFPVNNLFK